MESWTWSYHGYEPEQERLREALCTLGNGWFATRGAGSETLEATPEHYAGTYRAGCYNRLASAVAGQQVDNEDMVNLPNWLPLRYRMIPEGAGHPGPWLSPGAADSGLTEHVQTLDLRHGTLLRRSVYEDQDGRRLVVEQLRLVHLGDPHLAALRTSFSAEGWDGALEVDSGLDGDVRNANVERYRALSDQHLAGRHTGAAQGEGERHADTGRADGGVPDAPDDAVWLRCRTVQSGIRIALAARTRLTGPDDGADVLRRTRLTSLRAFQSLRVPVRAGDTVIVDKTVALHTSLDPDDPRGPVGTAEPVSRKAAPDEGALLLAAALESVRTAPAFPDLLATHHAAWEDVWERVRLDVPGKAGRILRLHLFHLLQTLSPHTAAIDVGVPARGLHGEAYRGHVFWDELFVLPFLNLHFPHVSRALLGYRHRRLPAALRAARHAGLAGAMYPWQSGSSGREETQELHFNPRSGHWNPDHSHLQRHIGTAVAYNVWKYAQATGDMDFLYGDGAEMLLQVARFWSSSACWDGALRRHRILGVMGPDEYHDAYPDRRTPGLDDNAYTNVTAAWVLARALDLLREMPARRRAELRERLELPEDEPERWEELTRTLHVPYHSGVISQFEGYGDLAELDWAGYRARYGDIRRLDRILEAEGDSVNGYQASKQADVLMLGYLFPARELKTLFERLRQPLDDGIWRATVDYYLPRTSHGSTLSALVHGWVLARSRRRDAWRYCREALIGDVADVQGGTTPEGIHLGAMAGTLDFVQRGMTGLEPGEGELRLDPVPLPQLPEFRVGMRLPGHGGVDVLVHPDCVQVSVDEAPAGTAPDPVRVVLDGTVAKVPPGSTHRLDLPAHPEPD